MTPAEAIQRLSSLRDMAQTARTFAEFADPAFQMTAMLRDGQVITLRSRLVQALRDAAVSHARDLTAEADAMEALGDTSRVLFDIGYEIGSADHG